MCGIVAVFGKDTYPIAETALNKIKHRGKDATKLLLLSFGTIGFNRLSINDKSDKAMQPFEFGNLVGVFNADRGSGVVREIGLGCVCTGADWGRVVIGAGKD